MEAENFEILLATLPDFMAARTLLLIVPAARHEQLSASQAQLLSPGFSQYVHP
jgi:hypothetical protein